jgi:hypothetical protein
MRTPPPVKVSSIRPGQKDQPAVIVDGSPLAIIGIFVSFLRERYAPGNGPSDYPWYEDHTKTKLVIESGFEDDHGERGKKPALFVDKDESVYAKTHIGDRAGYRFTDKKDIQWCFSTVPVIIDCVSHQRAESAILGDITQWSIHASSDALQATFALHDMSPPRLGRTVPYEADREAWSTPVSFSVQYIVRWTTVPVLPLLQEIVLKIRQSGLTSAEFLTEVALRNPTNLP